MGDTGAEGDDVPALFARLPEGWSEVRYAGARWGVTRHVRLGCRAQWVYAEELGGPGVVSANLYDDRLRPCEMPAEQVLAFLRGWHRADDERVRRAPRREVGTMTSSGSDDDGQTAGGTGNGEALGRLDDAAEEAEQSSTTDGPAAEGDYDPAQGSPDSGPHTT